MKAEVIISKFNALHGKSATLSSLREQYAQAKAQSTVPAVKEVLQRLGKTIDIMKSKGMERVKIEVKKIKSDSSPLKKSKQPLIRTSIQNDSILHGLETENLDEKKGLGFTQAGQQKIYNMVTDMILDAMKRDDLFWRKPWSVRKVDATGSNIPSQNFATKKIYRGVNYWITNFIAPSYGKQSPFFLTFKQVQEMEGSVKKGSMSFPILYYNWIYFITIPVRKNISEQEYLAMTIKERADKGAQKIGFVQYYSVFNADDIEGIDFPKTKELKIPKKEQIETCERIAEGMPQRPAIKHGGDEAYYSPGSDYIQMPPIDYFDKEQEYYSTLFHEMIHSTGAPKRLNREFGKRFGDAKYAFEELIAELGASYLCAESGVLYFTLKNTAAYLKGWSKRVSESMKKDNQFFLRAAAKAQQASDFILNVKENSTEENVKAVSKKTDRKSPVTKAKKQTVNMSGIVSSTQLGKPTTPQIQLDGQWKKELHRLYEDSQVMVSGPSGSGKTVKLMCFAKYLAQKGYPVLYVANEEMGRSTFDEKIEEFDIRHPNLFFVRDMPKDLSRWKVIFADSIQTLGWTLKNYKAWRLDNPKILSVVVVQSTKDGDFRGGNDWKHEMDVYMKVSYRKFIPEKNRYDKDAQKKMEELLMNDAIVDAEQRQKVRLAVKEKLQPKQSKEKEQKAA